MIPCIVPARGGSKGIPNKNLALLGGRPLIAWPVRAALHARLVQSTICSTDSIDIAQAALDAGATCNQLRPPELAGDGSLVIDVLRHELDVIRGRGHWPSYVCLVQATSPFVTSRHIDDAIKLARDGSFDVVCSGRAVGADHPDAMFEIDPASSAVRWVTDAQNRSRRRQDGPRLHVRAGLVYVFNTAHLDDCGDDYFSGRTGCLAVDDLHAQSIDTRLDLAWCEFLLESYRAEMGLEEDSWMSSEAN